MNIGEAAAASGVSAKMIRYYERIALLPPPDRRDSGYRVYGDSDVHRLRFVKRARDLGFPVETIRALLGLWGERGRSSAEVRKLALGHVTELESQAARLREMIETLRDLVEACAHGDRPDCPIIAELGGGLSEAPAAPASRRSRSRVLSERA